MKWRSLAVFDPQSLVFLAAFAPGSPQTIPDDPSTRPGGIGRSDDRPLQ